MGSLETGTRTQVSEDLSIELRVRLLDHGLLVVLVHLRQGVAGLVQVSGDVGPPNGEMLPDHIPQVRSVGRRLSHQILEDLARSLPSGRLNAEERGQRQANRQSHGHVDRWSADLWAHDEVRGTPSNRGVRHELPRELLQLPGIELLHSQDFIVGQVVIIDVREPVPILRGRYLCNFLVSSVEVLVESVRRWVEFLLHGHEEEGLPLLIRLPFLQ